MKALTCLMIYLLWVPCLYSQESDKTELNAQGRDFLVRIQAALVTLSKTNPALQGIESANLKTIDPKFQNKQVYQKLEFTKNVTEWGMQSTPRPSGPFVVTYYSQTPAVANHTPIASGQVVHHGGISILVVILENPTGRLKRTKGYQLSNDPDSLGLYYDIELCAEDDKAANDQEKKAIEAVLAPFGQEFLDWIKSQPNKYPQSG